METRPLLSLNKALGGDENIRSIYQDSESIIWVGTEAGLFFWDEKLDKFHRLNLPDFTVPQTGNIFIRSILEDSHGKLWIGAEGGLYLFQREDSSIVPFLHDPENAYSINNNDVISLLEDRSGVLWFGMDNGGINYVDERGNPFHFLGSYTYSPKNPLDNQMVRAISQLHNRKFLVGTMKGGLRFCDSSYQNCEIFQRTTPGIPKNFSNKIYSTWEDPQGQLWAADEECEIFKLLPDQDKLIPYPYSPCPALGPLEDKNLGIDYFDFYQDSTGGLWALTLTKDQNPGGIYRYQADLDSFICWKETVPYAHLLTSQDVYSMVIQGNIFWIGTTDGLFKIDIQKGIVDHYEENLSDPNGLTSNHVQSLRLDRNGILWVGVPHLLHTLNTHTDEWASHMDPLNWLQGGVKSMEVDPKGNMWIATQQGILKARYPGEFIPFGAEDGLEPVHEFHMQASSRNSISGHIMFGGSSGFIYFHPDSVFENTMPPPVHISRLTRYTDQRKGKSFIQEELFFSGQKKLALSHRDRILTFEIAALNYFKHSKNLYRYRLEGFQKDWINLGTENKFTLTNLDPGKYTLWVMASNSDGVWNEVPTRLDIKILPPWWKTQWAYWVYAVLVVAALFWGFYIFRKREKKKRLQLQKEFELQKIKELEAQRSRFFANISHDFRTPLTLIQTPVREQLSGLEKNEELGLKGSYAKEFFNGILNNCSILLRLINQILKLSQLEAGLMTLKTSEQDLFELLKNLYKQFEPLAESKNIEFSLEAEQEEFNVYIDREKMEMVFLNLLSNSFKFTPEGGEIVIRVRLLIEEVEITFNNTGKSIPKEELPYVFDRYFQGSNASQESTLGLGIGLAIVRELVELHKGSIKAEPNSPESTSFKLNLLLGKNHLRPEEIESKTPVLQKTDIAIDEADLTSSELRQLDIQRNREGLILIVEDKAPMRKLLNEILAPSYNLIFASNGLEGWNKAQSEIPDLIISDLMMPEFDGLELCKRIKGHSLTSHIPVILLTAKDEDPTRLESLRKGADIFLTKPFFPEELRLNMTNLLDRQKKIQQYMQRTFFQQFPSSTWKDANEALSEPDQKFIQRLIKIVEINLDNPSLGVEELSKEIGYSRVHLFRKLKAISDTKPLDFIQKIRLAHAAQLLLNTDLGIAEIAYSVGFSSPSHFGDRFKRIYDMPPSKFRKKEKKPSESTESPK